MIPRPVVVAIVAGAITLAGWPAAHAVGAFAPVTSEKLAAKIQAAGLGCDDYEEQRPSAGIVGPTPTTEGRCTADAELIEFHTYKDAEVRATAISAAETLGCELSKGFTGESVHRLVVGKTWIVNTESKGTAKKLAKVLKGKASVIRCDDD